MTSHLNAGGYNITALANAISSTDALPLGQADSRYLLTSGDQTLSGRLTLDVANTAINTGHLSLTNGSAVGQNVIDATINGTFRGRWRADYVGNVSYVANGGSHGFYVGGDAGTGTNTFTLPAAGGATVVTGNLGLTVGTVNWPSGMKGANGTGSGATLGNIGGTGRPTSTSQDGWLKILINGTTYYVPIWQ